MVGGGVDEYSETVSGETVVNSLSFLPLCPLVWSALPVATVVPAAHLLCSRCEG